MSITLCVCEVRNGPPSSVNFGPDKPHAGHPWSVIRCMPLSARSHTPNWKKYFENFNLLWLECPRPSVGRHCLRSSCRTFPYWERGRGERRGGVENREFRTCCPKGDVVVLLPCPNRVRTDVHGAVVDGFHTATVVWQWWTCECVQTKKLLVKASAALKVDGVVDTRST